MIPIFVYLVTCAKCDIQYVGMTSQAICSRFDGHRTKIRNKTVATALCRHYSKTDHSVSDMKVQIIYHYTKDDTDAKDVLLHVEDFYMKKTGHCNAFRSERSHYRLEYKSLQS